MDHDGYHWTIAQIKNKTKIDTKINFNISRNLRTLSKYIVF